MSEVNECICPSEHPDDDLSEEGWADYYWNMYGARTAEEIVAETATTTITERGATRLDDQTSDASMEQRKKEGYF